MVTFMMKAKAIKQRANEKEFPKDYTCSFLEQGLVSYEDVGAGVALLKKETIDRMLSSIIGKPVLIDHKDVTPADFKKYAVGYVTAAYFNSDDGMFYCKFILTDDEAKKVVEQGYSVSCSFNVNSTIGGGEYHAIKYDEEITGAEFTHLALVSNPRYEECKIYANGKGAIISNTDTAPILPQNPTRDDIIQRMKFCRGDKAKQKLLRDEVAKRGIYPDLLNTIDALLMDSKSSSKEGVEEGATIKSPIEILYGPSKEKTNKEVKMFGFKGKKNAQESVDPKDPAKEKFNAAEAFVMIDNEKVSIETLLNSAEEKEEPKKENMLSVEDVIEFNGKEINIADLVAKYQSNRQSDKKKADDGCDKKKDDDKKNEAIGKDNPEPQEVVDKAKQADKKMADDGKKKKDDGKAEEEEEAEEKDGKKKKNDVKFFKRLNSMKDGGEVALAVAVDTLSNKIERGADKYGSNKKK